MRTFDDLGRAELAALVPELLLCGHLIDRAGMPHVIGALDREGMGEVAIEEWMAASPVYTLRMRAALGLDGAGVSDLFKCLQHDIGAPPQFLDFRFTVHDEQHGEFALAHCGALMDVEPMGEDYVVTMCHDIEDPTFDATAIATNPRARIRPLHRPPRVPSDRHPHCAWTVVIDEANAPLPSPEVAVAVGRSRAATFPLETRRPVGEEGLVDYCGALQADVDWSLFTQSLLVRLADEISLQWHLLALGFAGAVARRTTPDVATDIVRNQLIGIAGLSSLRLRAALGLPASIASVPAVLAVHPVLNPAGYVGASIDGDLIRFDRSAPGHLDAGWVPLLVGDDLAPLQALVHGVAPTLSVEVVDDSAVERVVRFVDTDESRPDPPEVQLAKFSSGADFRFTDRSRSLPITPV